MRHLRRPLALIPAIALALLFPLLSATPAGAAPLDPPALLSPDNPSQHSSNPVFRWSAVDGAARYRIRISTASTFASTVYDSTTVNTNATPSTDLPQGTLFWQVATINAANEPGAYSATSSFDKVAPEAPALREPLDAQVIDFPDEPAVFSWHALPEMKSYDIQIDDDAQFTPPLMVDTNTANTHYTLTNPQTVGQTFYWRVRGRSTANLPTEFSAVRGYQFAWPQVPVLVAPLNQLVPPAKPAIEEIAFQWEPVRGAASYDIQVSPNIEFTGTLSHSANVKSTRYSPTTTLGNGAYYWRVRAKNNSGGLGSWSATSQFTKAWPAPDDPNPATPNPALLARVTLTAPADGNVAVRTPTFSWTPVRLGSTYRIEISSDANFSPGKVVTCSTTHTTYTPIGNDCNPNPGTLYYWRVRAVDDPSGVLGLYSAVRTFLYQPPQVTLTGPANGTATSTPVFSWNPIDDIGRYRVEVFNKDGARIINADTYNTQYVPGPLDVDDSPFSWRVSTLDGNGRVGPVPFSTRWFDLIEPSSTHWTPTPTSDPTVHGVNAPLLTWRAVAGAHRYNVWLAPAGVSIYTKLNTTEISQPAYAHLGDNISVGSFTFFVEALAEDGSLIDDGALGSFTIDQMPTTALTGPCAGTCPAEPTLLDTPTLTWTPVPRATKYLVTLASDPAFTNVTSTYTTQYSVITPTEALKDSQAGSSTYWYARPCYGNHCGPEAGVVREQSPNPILAFKKQSRPVITTATASVVADQVTFSWQDYLVTNQPVAGDKVSQSARGYRIEVSTVADFSTILDTAIVDQTTYTAFSKTYPEGPLYWRVQAIDGSGNSLTWSLVRTFSKASPAVTLLQPTSGGNAARAPLFQWQPQSYAVQYEVEAYRFAQATPDFNTKAYTTVTRMAAASPTGTLPPGAYGWRVRRLDADGRPGPWTATTAATLRPFTIAGDPAVLKTPAAGALNQDRNLVFEWDPPSSEPPVQYRLQTSTSPTFSPLKENQTTVMTSWAPTALYTDGTYHWRVQSLDSAGNVTATSDVRTFGRTIPGAPTGVTATPIDGGAVVSWNAPAFDGSSPIYSYVVSASPGGLYTTVGATTSTTFTGLENGTAYTFTVQAVNLAGPGPASAPSSAVTPASVPAMPTWGTVTPGNQSVALTWTAPANGGAPITGYTITVSPGDTTIPVGNVTSHTVTGLTNGKPYSFTITATNAIGTGESSVSTGSVTPRTVPGAPTGVTATPGNGQAVVGWTAPASNGGSPVTGYVVVASPGGATRTVGLVTSATFDGLTNGTAYTFQVRAVNGAGNGTLSTASPAVTPRTFPGVPTAVAATPGNGSATVTWTAPVSNGGSPVTGYKVTASPGGATVTVGNVTTATVPGLANGMAYTFTVRATNVAGDSAASLASPATTPRTVPGVPAGVAATPANGSATVTWTAPASNGGSAITGYKVTASPGGATVTVGDVLTATVPGLTNGTSYTFTVQAINVAGTGTASSPSAAITVGANLGAGYHSVVPTRMLDSRGSEGGWSGKLPGGGNGRTLKVGGTATVPAKATAVVMNVTVTDPSQDGFLTVYPAGVNRPNSSNLNFTAGRTIPNLVTVKLGADGGVGFYLSGGATHVIADVVGYYDDGTVPGELFNGVAPHRALDSRSATGGWNGPLAAGAPRSLTVRGVGGVTQGATTVVANVTVTGANTGSFLTAWPSDVTQPTASNLNYSPGQTIPNLVTVKIGSDGKIKFATGNGSVHVLVDIVGYFDPSSGSRFHAVTPTRVLDDRENIGLNGPWGPNQSRSLSVSPSVPTAVPGGATAVVMNVTATGSTAGGYVSVYPTGATKPTASNLNFTAGLTIPNAVVVKTGTGGKVDLYNFDGKVDLIGDVVGYYTSA